MHVNLDPQLVGKIVNEVKSQGAFDQFRKDCMSDVDTKPAYQNLRQRVENTVSAFLSDQKWRPDMNKNQLREKLRKHIAEANFLDVGVERIVDQVVNPKISTVFQPKIEDIAYKFLGVEKPKPKPELFKPTLPPLYMNGSLEIKTDLMHEDLEQVSPDSDKATVKSEPKDDSMEVDDKADDFESPPFELIDGAGSPLQNAIKREDEGEQKSSENVSDISGLTSNSSANIKLEEDVPKSEEKVVNASMEITQESELSEVSSNSRLSLVTNEVDETQSHSFAVNDENNVAITEEAQMPKFNENSNSHEGISEPLHFDIKKDEIKFEGTDRNAESNSLTSIDSDKDKDSKSEVGDKTLPESDVQTPKETEETFNFSKMQINSDPMDNDSKTLDDSNDKQLKIVETLNSSESQSQSAQFAEFTEPQIDDSKKEKSSKHRSSSSSSSHKKHSKDKRSDRDRDRHHKHSSSSSSKPHTSRHEKSSSKDHKSVSSSSSHKSSRRDDRHEKSSSSSSKSRGRSDREKERSSKPRTNGNDDHYHSKNKNQRRKSTDSNDGDSSRDTSKVSAKCSQNSHSRTKDAASGGANNATAIMSDSNQNGPNDHVDSEKIELATKPVILDSLLDNPSTQFIRMDSTGVHSVQKNDAVEDETGLRYFNAESDVNDLLKQAQAVIQKELLQLATEIEGFWKDAPSGSEGTNSDCSSEGRSPSKKRPLAIPSASSYSSDSDGHKTIATRATLTIDCIQYDDIDGMSKKFKFEREGERNKNSPTPSDLSSGYKENEFEEKNAIADLASNTLKSSKKPEKRSSQRYSSEDLYKPRPILSHRSRRRGVDTEVI